MINLLIHQTNVTRIVLVFSPHLSSPLPHPTHCAAVPPQRPLIRKCDLALCTFDATSPLPPPLPPICTPVMSAPFICETEQRKDLSTDKDLVLLSFCHRLVLSTSSLLLSSFLFSFHRNSKASTSSRYISLLPTVTWHCRPDPPSARMVSTTVSKSFFYYSFIFILL